MKTARLLPALLPAARAVGLDLTSAACAVDRCEVALSPGLTASYQVHLPYDFEFYTGDPDDANKGWACEQCRVSVRLLHEGLSWVGFGPSPSGRAIGSRVVIGMPGKGDPRDYYLRGEDDDDPERVTEAQPVSEEGLDEARVEYVGGRTILSFDMKFRSWGIQTRIGPRVNNEYTFIWAHGEEGEAEPTDGPNGWASRTFANFLGFAPAVVNGAKQQDSAASEEGRGSVAIEEESQVNVVLAAALVACGVMCALTVVAWTMYCRRRGRDAGDVEMARKDPRLDAFDNADPFDDTRENDTREIS